MRIDKTSVERYLATIQEIGASVRLTDCHAHPYEVMYDDCRYEPNSEVAGVYSTGKACYVPPMSAAISLEAPASPDPDTPRDLVERMMLLTMRRRFTHTGPQYWLDQARLAGLGRFVLLAVAQPGRTADVRMAEMARMFGDDPHFLWGYSLPNTLAPERVEEDIQQAIKKYEISVLKVHPTLSGHELTAVEGRARVDALLKTAQKVGMPVIVHGGKSPSVRYPPTACQQGELDHLAKLDLAGSCYPIVIAHAGAFGIGAEEFQRRVLPQLHELLSKYDHLLVDTSALSVDVLSVLVGQVEPERILFGSDALYELSWKAAVKLYWVLEQQFSRPEDLFALIAGENPEKLFIKEV
ncbi:hypothetical protein A7E78_03230 [Syntrophotalea acetylenivorans]|uniref:Amidohydrolase-related domain-containing protein n=1 Tax=Syntrophotalea acetylenivorans TaxID=1842532 RepID=A0A1L3GLY4_9BACT|nr:amidohydrolase family protein [Syntrophotalea acetylenivorans]APG26932.1 hypothetical protein A7E78_03230 [Syntrophotalea acetylenivorans]